MPESSRLKTLELNSERKCTLKTTKEDSLDSTVPTDMT